MGNYGAIYIDGFGDINFNGLYQYYNTVNGRTVFRKNDHYFLYYAPSYGPYTYEEGYFLVKKNFSQGAISIEKVRYLTRTTNIANIDNAIWIGLTESGAESTSSGHSTYIDDIGAIGVGIIELTFRVG